jgi:CYTH domain-containing protein
VIHKDGRIEHERRFLVEGDAWKDGGPLPSRLIEDLYLRNTALRIRVITELDGTRVLKLSKKYPSESRSSRYMTTMLLDPAEHALLDALPGHRLRKRRHYRIHDAHKFCIDVFERTLAGLVLCEVEADTAAELVAIAMPPWVTREVTDDPSYDGGQLAGRSKTP